MPLRPQSRTLSIIRFLRAAGQLPRRRRIPRQQQPDLIRREYFKAILPFLGSAHRAFAQVKDEIIRLLEEERRSHGKMDDGDRSVRARRLIDAAAERAANSFEPKELAAVARRFGKRTSDFQREQLDRQVRAAMSIPLSVLEKPIADKLADFAAVNVDLIKTVPDRYFDRIRRDVLEAFESGMHPDTLSEHFQEDYDMSENDAERIASDQIGKLNGELNQERQESLGVTKFIWHGTLDNRERDSHRELEGQEFPWEEPPTDEETGEEIIPGSAINCRCWAEPVFSEILVEAAEG